MGGTSEEREISLRGGRAIHKALLEKGYNAIAIDVNKDIVRRLMEEEIDVAFIALHGRYGEDGTIQGLLEVMGIPYTGSGVLASAMALDKVVAKKAFTFHGIPTPEWEVVSREWEVGKQKGFSPYPTIHIPPPVVVKPTSQGSTIGVTVVKEEGGLKAAFEEAWRYGDTVIVERCIEGREITVGILNGRALPIIEIRPKEGIYDYKAKYTPGMTEYIVPARLDERVEERVKEIALKAYQVLGCRGVARVDMILACETPYLLEVNTIPGMTELSLIPKAAASSGIGFSDLVEEILLGAFDPCFQDYGHLQEKGKEL